MGLIKKLIRKIIKKLAVHSYFLGVKVLPVNNNIILFESNLGRNYTGNPRYIYEKMVSMGMDQTYKCIWILEDVNTNIPGHVIKIKRSRFQYLYYMAIAKVWVFDCRQPQFLIKRKETTYIQTWHGTPLKKLALDMDMVSMAGSGDIDQYRKNFFENTRTWDYLISQNDFSTEIFKRCFAFDKTMLSIGYPRNDMLINENNKEFVDALKIKMGLPLDKKVLLYAPTWRDNEFYGKGKYKFVSPLDYDKFRQELGDEYILIVKYHYLVKETINWDKYKGFIYQFSEQEDIASLYMVSDALITDYSSVMFDYSLLGRPMYFFAYDIEDYKNNLRGFYFDLTQEAPGPISLNTQELIRDIKEFSPEDWTDKYKAYSQKYNHLDDGKASLHVVELIQQKMR